MLCDYGCGQKGKFYFPTVDKWCCENHWSRCPEQKKRTSNKNNSMFKKDPWNKGKTGVYSNETLIKMRQNSSQLKGKTYEEIHGKEKAKILKEQRSKDFSRIRKGRDPWNKGKTGVYSKETLKKIKEKRIYNMEDYKEKYPTFIKEEKPRINNDGYIEVRCNYCSVWFIPTKNQLYERLRKFDKNFKVTGNSYFYCSDFCKYKCEKFNRKVDPEKLKKFKRYVAITYRETYKTIKKYPEKILNLNLRGNKYNYELDHRYSIYNGFINNISPKKLAHYKNLKVITKIENRSKKSNSSISLETLLSFL